MLVLLILAAAPPVWGSVVQGIAQQPPVIDDSQQNLAVNSQEGPELPVLEAASFITVCDIKLKQRKRKGYACCRARKPSLSSSSEDDKEHADEFLPFVSIGVCADNIIGFLDHIRKSVSTEEAFSDPDATEDKPGIDEGSCHVYQVFREKESGVLGRSGCLPGNMIMTAQKIHSLLGNIGKREGTCHLHNIHSACDEAEPLDPGTPYSFDIQIRRLISSRALARLAAEVRPLGCTVIREENERRPRDYVFVRCEL